jgi:hypothetical protein
LTLDLLSAFRCSKFRGRECYLVPKCCLHQNLMAEACMKECSLTKPPIVSNSHHLKTSPNARSHLCELSTHRSHIQSSHTMKLPLLIATLLYTLTLANTPPSQPSTPDDAFSRFHSISESRTRSKTRKLVPTNTLALSYWTDV